MLVTKKKKFVNRRKILRQKQKIVLAKEKR